MRQRIGLDARKLARRSVEGIGHYVHQLACRLPDLAPELEFLLLTDRPIDAAMLPSGCRQVVLGRAFPEGGTWARVYSPVWTNFLVPDLLRREKVDLYHATNYALPATGSCRYVLTVHDIAFIKKPQAFSFVHRRYLISQVELGIRRADWVITGSEAAREDLVREVGIGSDRLSVIHHGIDDRYTASHTREELRNARAELGLPERFVLHVGAVEAKKNIEALLRACSLIAPEGLVDGIVLAGREGRGADSVRRTAASLRLLDTTHFLGYVPLRLMPALYALAQVLVYPSWYEGFGLPVLEAMACGTPVIASDSSSLPEVAGGAAVLFPPGSAVALEGALRGVLQDSQLRDDLRERGLARAACFSWDSSARRHLEIYRRALGTGQS